MRWTLIPRIFWLYILSCCYRWKWLNKFQPFKSPCSLFRRSDRLTIRKHSNESVDMTNSMGVWIMHTVWSIPSVDISLAEVHLSGESISGRNHITMIPRGNLLLRARNVYDDNMRSTHAPRRNEVLWFVSLIDHPSHPTAEENWI